MLNDANISMFQRSLPRSLLTVLCSPQAHLMDAHSQLQEAEAERRACEQRALAPLVAQLHRALIELAQRDGFADAAQLHIIRQKLVRIRNSCI